MRLFCCFPAVLLFIAALPISSMAGDFAQVHVFGFSKDGKHFAFEQYGVQDGSGFPYSEIFVLNVANDSWVKPTPFRRRDKIDDSNGYDEDALLSVARAENRGTAQSLLAQTGIAGKGLTVGHNPPTELNSDPLRLVVNPRQIVPPIDDPVEIRLEEKPISTAECAPMAIDATQGFRLTLTFQGKTRVLNNDTSLPKSRRCPLRYRIERVVTYYPDNGSPVFAVLVQMESYGFEGPDGRFLAITGTL
ncbi:MAG: DUF2259 domain-containing protein [Roseibium sp.]